MVPSTGWDLRKRRGALLVSFLLWIGSLAAVICCMQWFARQPYSVPDSILGLRTSESLFLRTFFFMLGEVLCLAMVTFPLTVSWLPRLRRIKGNDLAAIAVVLLAWTTVQWTFHWTLPWIQNVILFEFATPSFTTFMLPIPGCLLVSAVLVAAILTLFVSSPIDLHPSSLRSNSAFWILAPYSLAYFALLLPRAMQAAAFDRYALGLMPAAVVFFIGLHQRTVAPNLPASSIVTLGLFALLAIAGTHDSFAGQRARLAAIDEIRASGVPRTAIQGGFEYDGWTQLEFGGHIDDPRIKIPSGAYKPDARIPQVAMACLLDFASCTPAVQPKYSVVPGREPCPEPGTFPPVEFHAWLPPFKRTVCAQQIPAH